MEIFEVLGQLFESWVKDVVEDVFSVGNLDFSVTNETGKSGNFRLVLFGSVVIILVVFRNAVLGVADECFNCINKFFEGGLGLDVELSKSKDDKTEFMIFKLFNLLFLSCSESSLDCKGRETQDRNKEKC
jgi:hypothetical protein